MAQEPVVEQGPDGEYDPSETYTPALLTQIRAELMAANPHLVWPPPPLTEEDIVAGANAVKDMMQWAHEHADDLRPQEEWVVS